MSKITRKTFSVTEVSEITGVEPTKVLLFIQREWIIPMGTDEIDHEDIARIHLIEELQRTFGANDESIPLILHLMDQLYFLREQLRKKA